MKKKGKKGIIIEPSSLNLVQFIVDLKDAKLFLLVFIMWALNIFINKKYLLYIESRLFYNYFHVKIK